MTESAFMALAQKRYAGLQALNKINSFYYYEKKFDKIWLDLGREVLKTSISVVPDNRLKKTLTKYRKISISKQHCFCDGGNDFQISPHLQELPVYAGQLDCYERSNEVLRKFIDVDVSASQVYLVTDCYGKLAETEVNVSCSLEPVKEDEVLYVQTDGSMLRTRDKGWKEVKVGRMFMSGS